MWLQSFIKYLASSSSFLLLTLAKIYDLYHCHYFTTLANQCRQSHYDKVVSCRRFILKLVKHMTSRTQWYLDNFIFTRVKCCVHGRHFSITFEANLTKFQFVQTAFIKPQTESEECLNTHKYIQLQVKACQCITCVLYLFTKLTEM